MDSTVSCSPRKIVTYVGKDNFSCTSATLFHGCANDDRKCHEKESFTEISSGEGKGDYFTQSCQF